MRVRARVSFNGIVKGETADVDGRDRTVRGWVRAGLMEVVDRGESEDRSRRDPESDPGGVDAGAPEGGAAGGEPGEDPLSG
jgi:hypothetical protein